MIKLTHVSKSFDGGQTYSVKDLSFQVRKGETLVLLGSSGCGKTTTLKMINRLIELTQGTVEVDGKDVMGRNFYFACFQNDIWLSANITFKIILGHQDPFAFKLP